MSAVVAHRARRVRACVALREACGGGVDAEDYARAVEAGVQRGVPLVEYGATVSALVHALRLRPELRDEYADGGALATVAPSALETERARAIVEGFRAEEEAKKAGLTKIKVAAGQTRCRKCGGTDIVFFQRQTRSADEPATVFYICQKQTCMARWRS